MKYKSISVFLPVYNEEENIRNAILTVRNYLKKNFLDFEILVISDGSSDNTNKIVKNESKKDKRIKLISRKKKLGYGSGLRSGISNSKKNLIFYTDGDNQFDIKELGRLVPLLDKFDIISAYRINRKDPLMRIFIAWIYNILINLFFGLNVRDVDASFKLFKRKIFKDMKLITTTGLTDAEILIKAKKKGFKIGQVGVSHYPRPHGRTSYEMGIRNNFIAFVRPMVIFDILEEVKLLRKDLNR